MDKDCTRDGGSCLVMLSGCSGGGKSTLLEELARRGHATVAEPGRRFIAEVRAGGDGVMPWEDPASFARRAMAMSVADHVAARGITFFDRGVVDAGVALTASCRESPAEMVRSCRYDLVFLAPRWPDIYVNDADRRHSLEKAVTDFDRVRLAYLEAAYDPVMLRLESVSARADFVEETLKRHLDGKIAPRPFGPR